MFINNYVRFEVDAGGGGTGGTPPVVEEVKKDTVEKPEVELDRNGKPMFGEDVPAAWDEEEKTWREDSDAEPPATEPEPEPEPEAPDEGKPASGGKPLSIEEVQRRLDQSAADLKRENANLRRKIDELAAPKQETVTETEPEYILALVEELGENHPQVIAARRTEALYKDRDVEQKRREQESFQSLQGDTETLRGELGQFFNDIKGKITPEIDVEMTDTFNLALSAFEIGEGRNKRPMDITDVVEILQGDQVITPALKRVMEKAIAKNRTRLGKPDPALEKARKEREKRNDVRAGVVPIATRTRQSEPPEPEMSYRQAMQALEKKRQAAFSR